MTDNFLAKQYVDHYIQAAMIQQLSLSEEPLRFSELKEDGIENSLFMYHANKLIDRGIIDKQNGGFGLTIKGARWANYVGTSLLGKQPLPRPLVQCIITSKDSVLVATRIGSMKGHLNEHILPGGLHHSGVSAGENIELVLRAMFSEKTDKPTLLGNIEAIITHDDGFVHHTLISLFAVELSSCYEPQNTEKFEYGWTDIKSVKSDNSLYANSKVVPRIIQNRNEISGYEIIKINQ